MWENENQDNSKYGPFSCSVNYTWTAASEVLRISPKLAKLLAEIQYNPLSVVINKILSLKDAKPPLLLHLVR